MKSLEKIIQPKLGASVGKAIQKDRQIKDLISRIVPVSTAVHIVFCRLEDERLRITVDNAVWLPRLRFMERHIIDTLRAERLAVDSVSCHVMPEVKEVVPTRRTVNPTSSRAAGMVQATADSVDDDRLEKALQKMARLMSETPGDGV